MTLGELRALTAGLPDHTPLLILLRGVEHDANGEVTGEAILEAEIISARQSLVRGHSIMLEVEV